MAGKITSALLNEKVVSTKDNQTTTAKFGFMNFENTEGAQKAHDKAKSDEEVLELLNKQIPNYKEFLFYHQTKGQRQKFLADHDKKAAQKKPLDFNNMDPA